jgi:MFS family permease
MGGLYALPSWFSFMNEPSGTYLGWINACYFLTNGLFFPVGAWVSEKYGRKKSIYIGYVVLFAGIAMQSAAQNEKSFTYARLLIGAGSAFISVAAPVIISEVAFPSHRSIVSALYMCGYYVGGTLSGWVTFGTRVIDNSWAWRIPIILQVACPLLALTGFIMSPESPRWLISVGKIDEARQILANFHAGGDHDSPVVTYQMTEIEAAITAEKEHFASTSYMDMTKTPGNRHRLLISTSLGIFSQWAGNGVVSYYLPLMLKTVGIKTVSEQTLISACLNVWNLLWAIAAAFYVDRLGRRFLFLTSATVMLISFIAITGLSGSFATNAVPAIGLSVIPFIFIFFAGYDIAL